MAVDPCTEYGLALALEDFVPVLLAGAGTVVLGQYAGRVLPEGSRQLKESAVLSVS